MNEAEYFAEEADDQKREIQIDSKENNAFNDLSLEFYDATEVLIANANGESQSQNLLS